MEPADEARALVVGRLRARHDELVREIFARVRGDAFDRAGEHDAEYLAGLRATVAAALEYVLVGIERGEGGAGQIPAVALEQARRAARIGVSLDTVLRRYVVGSALLGDFIMQEADRGEGDQSPPTQRDVLRGVLRAQASGLERMLQAITAAFADELDRAGRSPAQRRAERVRGLLDGVVEGATVEASELGYALDSWHLGAIVLGTDAERAVRDLALGVGCRLLSVPQDERSVWAWLGGSDRLAFAQVEQVVTHITAEMALVEGFAPEAKGETSDEVMLALGEPAPGLAGWRWTHQQAQAALVVALRRPRRLTRYADVALLASALKDELLATTLTDSFLSPLEDPRGGGPALRETLRAYLGAERSVSSAAAALGVARKTVERRLRTIEERLGRTLHPCPSEIAVALELDGLGAVSPTPTVSSVNA